MNNKLIILSLFISMLALFGCSKTHDEYLNTAKEYMKEKKYNEAVINYEKACKKGSFKGCYALGNIYNKGEIVEKNNQKANIYYKSALDYSADYCSNKSNSEACILSAKIYESGLGVEKDLKISDNFHIKACDLGAFGSCYYIARIKADNMDDFLKYMDMACSYDFADSCLILGNTYLTGFNENMALLEKDVEKGLSYINKACKLNNQFCSNLADIYISGDDLDQNYTEALKYYNTALKYYENLCTTYDEDNIACKNINIIKSKYMVN